DCLDDVVGEPIIERIGLERKRLGCVERRHAARRRLEVGIDPALQQVAAAADMEFPFHRRPQSILEALGAASSSGRRESVKIVGRSNRNPRYGGSNCPAACDAQMPLIVTRGTVATSSPELSSGSVRYAPSPWPGSRAQARPAVEPTAASSTSTLRSSTFLDNPA